MITSTAAASGLRLKMMLLAICPKRHAQRIGRLLRRARGIIEHHRRMRMALGEQHLRHALHAFGQSGLSSAPHIRLAAW